VLDIGCDEDTCPKPDPDIEVLPVVQRGGYGLIYTKLRASVPEPPDIIINSPLEGTEQTGLFKVNALPEDESGILNVIFEYSTDHANWSPLPGPDSSTGKDGYGADGWRLRFDTVAAGIEVVVDCDRKVNVVLCRIEANRLQRIVGGCRKGVQRGVHVG